MLDSFAAIIDLWPSAEAFGDAIGTSGANARKMKARDSIDSSYWESLVAAAIQRGLQGVSLDLLARLAARRKGKAA